MCYGLGNKCVLTMRQSPVLCLSKAIVLLISVSCFNMHISFVLRNIVVLPINMLPLLQQVTLRCCISSFFLGLVESCNLRTVDGCDDSSFLWNLLLEFKH